MCRLPLARKIGCKSQVYSSYKLLLVRKLKKRGGNGAELVGGGIIALSYSTVLPHIDWGIKMCSCVFVYFFFFPVFILYAKKARIMLMYNNYHINKVFLIWFDLIWFDYRNIHEKISNNATVGKKALAEKISEIKRETWRQK